MYKSLRHAHQMVQNQKDLFPQFFLLNNALANPFLITWHIVNVDIKVIEIYVLFQREILFVPRKDIPSYNHINKIILFSY